MSKPNTSKSMSEVLSHWFEVFSDSLNSIKVGKITSVDLSKQTVDVQILHKRINENNLTRRELRDYPLLVGVPFIVLGGGGSHLTFPVSVGDNCLLMFCDFEIDRWWDSGEAQPSNFERRHDISDAFAIVGVHSLVDLIKGYSQYVELKYSDSSKITIGESIDLTNEQTNVSGKLDVTDDITGQAKATAELHDTRLANGSFATADQKVVTVEDGIIVSIS